MAEIARVLGEEFFPGSIVKMNSVAVRKIELEAAQGIGRAGPLANIDLRIAGGDRSPVDAVRRKHARIRSPGRENLISLLDEIGVPILEHSGAMIVFAIWETRANMGSTSRS